MTDAALAHIVEGIVPFRVALNRSFRGVTSREGLLIRGPSGWGEFAPFDDYDDAGSARWLDAALEAAYGQWPAPMRDRIATNAIVPATDPDSAVECTLHAVSLGMTTIKIKVGDDDEISRVRAVRQCLDSELGEGIGRIRLDANGAWDSDRAISVLRRLADIDIEYVEQPCASWAELALVRDRTGIPIAVDEGIRRANRVDVAAIRMHADVAIIKPMPLGGVAASLALAAELDMPVVVSGAMDTSVGLCTALALAAALPALDRACGLGTGTLLSTDVVAHSSSPHGGYLPVSRRAPDAQSLDHARAQCDRPGWWMQRLRDAWTAGSGDRWSSAVLDAHS